MKKFLLLTAFAAGFSLGAVEPVPLQRWDAERGTIDWDGGMNVAPEAARSGNKGYLIRGKKRLTTLKSVEIDPDMKYRATIYLRSKGSEKAEIYVGYVCYDENGKIIPSQAYHRVPGSLTSLTAPAKKGDTVLYVADGAKWKKANNYTVVFNAAADESDLPNYSSIGPVKEVKAVDGKWQITLGKPLTQDYAAGTMVREHTLGGDYYFYIAQVNFTDWKKITTGWTPGKNLRRAKKIKMVIISNLRSDCSKGEIYLDDVVFEVDGQNVSF